MICWVFFYSLFRKILPSIGQRTRFRLVTYESSIKQGFEKRGRATVPKMMKIIIIKEPHNNNILQSHLKFEVQNLTNKLQRIILASVPFTSQTSNPSFEIPFQRNCLQLLFVQIQDPASPILCILLKPLQPFKSLTKYLIRSEKSLLSKPVQSSWLPIQDS